MQTKKVAARMLQKEAANLVLPRLGLAQERTCRSTASSPVRRDITVAAAKWQNCSPVVSACNG